MIGRTRASIAELTEERHGMFGACTARAAAIHAASVVDLRAPRRGKRRSARSISSPRSRFGAIADDSAKYIFGDALGDPTADEILRALRAAPGGLTRTEIAALFDRHKSVSEISRALMVLHNRSLVRFELQKTKGGQSRSGLQYGKRRRWKREGTYFAKLHPYFAQQLLCYLFLSLYSLISLSGQKR